jgi:hypothetical protein
MSPQDWAAFTLTVLSIATAVGVGVRWVIKKYVIDIVSELKPNSGSSMKDQVTRLETKVDMLFEMFKEHLNNNKN